MKRAAIIVFSLALLTTNRLRAADDPPKLGAYSTPYAERSPLSAMTEISRRLGFTLKTLATHTEFEQDYNIANESCEVYVPESYKPAEKWGLIVWISAGRSGRPPDVFIPLLEKHKLIWAGPNNVQNERSYWCRLGLAVDAAEMMKKKYSIDMNRIYVSGGSGGGRTSSMTGVTYPDVFSGGLYVIGCNFYRDITVPPAYLKELEARGESPKVDGAVIWRKSYSPPPAKLFTMAKKHSRHVILTGETDMNRWQCKSNYEAFKKDGFEHVSYFEVPGVGHALPSADWLDKALDALEESGPAQVAQKESSKSPKVADKATTAQAEAALKAAKELAAKDPIAGHAALQNVANKFSDTAVEVEALKADEALQANPAVKKKITDAEDANRFLRNAKIYIDNQRFADARSRLDKILSDYPDAPAAKEAKELLKQIAGSE